MNKGFDVVVGNPPYIRQEKIDDMADGMEYKSMLGEMFDEDVKTKQKPDNKLGNTMDFSMYFIIRSRQLLSKNGYNSFIITNKWLRASYGEPIRHFLKHEVQLTKFIDFVNCNIFRGASVDTVVFSFVKSDENDGKISYCCPASLDSFAKSDHDYFCDQQLLDDKVWSFSDPLTEEIKQYIVSVGTPLKDMDVNINFGIKTGFNDAFIIDSETKNRLIDQDPKNDEIIKPLVKGKNINRYQIDWDDWWLIRFEYGRSNRLGIHNEDEFKEMYPILYHHFESFFDVKGKGKGLKQRDDQGDFWWELRPCDYYDEFERSKIVWQEITDGSKYYWDNLNIYAVNTIYLMSRCPKSYILILNSSLIKSYFTQISQTMSKGQRHWKQYVELISMVNFSNEVIGNIIVDYIQFNLDEYIDDLTNCLVYELYFHSKFHEDELYPEDEMYLLDIVKAHLKTIHYEEWSQLDWKRQLGEITDAEQERLDTLTEENERIINEVVEALQRDEEVKKWMNVIKNHKWIRKIEGELIE